MKLSCGIQYVAPGLLLLFAPNASPAEASSQDLSQQIVDILAHAPGTQPGHRVLHSKGIVCQGTFEASAAASAISRAAHFNGKPVPVTVRLSAGAPNPAIADNSPDTSPRGMAIRFMNGRGTDIVTNSHNGFIVGTGEEFLALVKAQAATDPSKPHPWPIEEFLGSHPRALKFVKDPKPIPVSYATEAFYANHAFRFVNAAGQKQAGRYQIIPVEGQKYLTDAEAKTKSHDFLAEEFKARLARGPVKFRLLLQMAAPGDRTDDSSVSWPEDRKMVELGVITITSTVADNAKAENDLAFDPTRLVDGIELSDDPLPALRSRVYAKAVAIRRSH
jgi:catalase